MMSGAFEENRKLLPRLPLYYSVFPSNLLTSFFCFLKEKEQRAGISLVCRPSNGPELRLLYLPRGPHTPEVLWSHHLLSRSLLARLP